MVIWKYELEVKDSQVLSLPDKAKVLTVQSINNKPNLFALVNPLADTVDRTVRVYGTGDTVDAGGKYVGSTQVDDGLFTYHIFEEK